MCDWLILQNSRYFITYVIFIRETLRHLKLTTQSNHHRMPLNNKKGSRCCSTNPINRTKTVFCGTTTLVSKRLLFLLLHFHWKSPLSQQQHLGTTAATTTNKVYIYTDIPQDDEADTTTDEFGPYQYPQPFPSSEEDRRRRRNVYRV